MAIYNAYLEGAEREAAILNMELNNQYDKLSMLYEMASMELEMAKKDIELKVLKESGTYDDYEYLVKEAEEGAAQDQQNILSQILTWFANAIQKMITSIKNFFNGSKDIPDVTQAEVSLPENESKLFATMDGILNSVANMDGKITLDNVIKTVGAVLGIGSLAGGAAALINKINKDYPIKTKIMKWAAVKSINNACNKTVGGLNNIITNVINKIQDSTVGKWICDNVLKPIQEKCQSLIDICTNAVGVFKGKVGQAVGAIKDAVTGKKGETTPTTPTQPAQTGPATINSAKTEGQGAGARIVVNFTDNSSGTPTNRAAYVSKDGKLIGSKDGKPIQAVAKSAIEGSQAVKDAVQRITKATEKAAMKNSPNAGLVQNSAEDLQLELGDKYTVEACEDGSFDIIINESIEIPEDYLSTTQSIFGMIAEEEANEDPEFEELRDFFNTL